MSWHDKLLQGIATDGYRAHLAQRRAARIREGREWAGVGGVVIIAAWCIAHWTSN